MYKVVNTEEPRETAIDRELSPLVMALAKMALMLGVLSIRAVAVAILWSWFMVPMGLLPVGWATAAGGCLLVSLALPGGVYASKTENRSAYEVAMWSLVFVAFALGTGWLFKLFL